MANTGIFSPLAMGFGSWDGDIQLPGITETSHSKVEKLIYLPLQPSYEHAHRPAVPFTTPIPPSTPRPNTVPPQAPLTPHGAASSTWASPRRDTHASLPSSARVCRHKHRHHRSKSAHPTTGERPSTCHSTREKSDGELILPKTYVTRKGAMLLFAAPADMDLSVMTEHERAYLDKASKLLKNRYSDYSRKFGSIQRLAHMVLTFGDQIETTDKESISDPNHQVYLNFLRELDSDTVDMKVQPGGDVQNYLRDLMFRSRHRSRPVTTSFRLSELRKEMGEDVRTSATADTASTQRIRQWRRKRLSADQLTASLKSLQYLGRPTPTPSLTQADEDAYSMQRHLEAYLLTGNHANDMRELGPKAKYFTGSPDSQSLRDEHSTRNHSQATSRSNSRRNSRRDSLGSVIGYDDCDPRRKSSSRRPSRLKLHQTDNIRETLEETAEILTDRTQREDTTSASDIKHDNLIHRTVEDTADDSLLRTSQNSQDESDNEEYVDDYEEYDDDEFEEELLDGGSDVFDGEPDAPQPLQAAYTGSLVGHNANGFSIADTAVANVNDDDVRIEDMSTKVLQHRDSVVSIRRASLQVLKQQQQTEAEIPLVNTEPNEQEPEEETDDPPPRPMSVEITMSPRLLQPTQSVLSSHSGFPEDPPPTIVKADTSPTDEHLDGERGRESPLEVIIEYEKKNSRPVSGRTDGDQSEEEYLLNEYKSVLSSQSPRSVEVGINDDTEVDNETQSRVSSAQNISQSGLVSEKEEVVSILTEDVPGKDIEKTEGKTTIKSVEHNPPPTAANNMLQLADPIKTKNKDVENSVVNKPAEKSSGKNTDISSKSQQEKPKSELGFQIKHETKPKVSTETPKLKDVVSPKPQKTFVQPMDVTAYESKKEEKKTEPKNIEPKKMTAEEMAKLLGMPSPPPPKKAAPAPKPKTTSKPKQIHRKKSIGPPPKTKEELEMEKLEKEVNDIFTKQDSIIEDDDEEEAGLTAEELELAAAMLKEKIAAAESKLKDDPIEKEKSNKKEKPEKAKKSKKGGKKKTEDSNPSQEDMDKKKEAIKEARKKEKEKRLEEARLLEEKIKKKETEKAQRIEEAQRKKKALDEELKELTDEANLAEEEEEEARAALVAARKLAREEREAKRKADIEKKKQEAIDRRREEKEKEEAARQKELELRMRIADAEEKRRLAEEERLRKEEEEEKERERQEEEERLAKQQAQEEEERIRELERQAEEEAMARLVEEREEAARKRRQKLELARQMEEEEEMMRQRLLEEEKRLEAERLRREEELQKRREQDRIRMEELKRLEAEAKAKMQLEMEKRREELLKRRDHNIQRRNHSEALKHSEHIHRPWVWTYYVLWPRDTYEKKIGGEDDKKKKMRPKPKKK